MRGRGDAEGFVLPSTPASAPRHNSSQLHLSPLHRQKRSRFPPEIPCAPPHLGPCAGTRGAEGTDCARGEVGESAMEETRSVGSGGGWAGQGLVGFRSRAAAHDRSFFGLPAPPPAPPRAPLLTRPASPIAALLAAALSYARDQRAYSRRHKPRLLLDGCRLRVKRRLGTHQAPRGAGGNPRFQDRRPRPKRVSSLFPEAEPSARGGCRASRVGRLARVGGPARVTRG